MIPNHRRFSGRRDKASLRAEKGPARPGTPALSLHIVVDTAPLGVREDWSLVVLTEAGTAYDILCGGCADHAAEVATMNPPLKTPRSVFILPGQLGRDAEIDRGRLGDSFPPSPSPGFPGSPR